MWIFPPHFPRESPESPGIFPQYFRMEISLIFPSKFRSVIKGHTKGPSCKKHPSDVLMSILW